jgi:hypothetical protein
VVRERDGDVRVGVLGQHVEPLIHSGHAVKLQSKKALLHTRV